jgi:hypothetical protein
MDASALEQNFLLRRNGTVFAGMCRMHFTKSHDTARYDT